MPVTKPVAPLLPGDLDVADSTGALSCGPVTPGLARKSRLLGRLLELLMPITLICGAIQWWARPSAKLHFILVLLAVGAAGMAYVLNRMNCYRQAAILTCALPTVGSLASLAITPEEYIAFAYPAVGIILAGMLLSRRSAIGLSVLNFAAILLLPVVQPAHPWTVVSAAAGFNAFLPILVLTGMKNRDGEEVDRQSALRSSEERWRSLIQHNPDPITIAVDGIYVYVNGSCLELLGATSESQVVGRPISDFAHPSRHGDLQDRVAQVRAGKRTYPMPFPVIGIDGRECRAEASSVPITYRGEPAALTVLRNITQQWVAERRLKESEAKFRAIVEHAPEAIVVIDLDTGRFVDCNTNAERLFGLDAAGMRVSGPVALSPKRQPSGLESGEGWGEFVARTVSGEVCVFEWTFTGSLGPVPCEVRLVRLPSDQKLLIRGSLTDISEKKQSEAALRSSEERYRTLIQTMNDGLVAVDTNLTISLVNERFREMFRAECSMIGKSLLDFVDEEGAKVLKQQYGLRRKGQAEPYEMTAIRFDGSPIEIRVTPSIIPGPDGSYNGSFGVVRDVTESKRLEDERRLVEAKIRSVVENSSDVITVLDQAGGIVFESPSLERMLGYVPEEVLGRPVVELIHADDVPAVISALHASAENPGVPHRLELRLLHKDGSWRIVEAVGKSLVESLDDWKVVVHSRDITERRRLEQELLGISNREQRRFGQDLHDGMGQVLVGARLYTAGLQRKLERRGADEAEGVAEVGRMLDEAHAQARALARGLSPVSLEEGGLVPGLEDLAEGLTRLYGVECALNVDSPIAIDDVDVATHVYRIAQEAATNAARHAHPSRVEVSIEQSNDRLRLVVRDDGEGFEPSPMGNRGMGIPIMRRRAAMLSGSLEMSSSTDGTVVSCTFPTVEPTVPSAQG